MGKITGFKEFGRETTPRRPVAERVKDWFEIYQDSRKRSCVRKALVAWIAGCLSATPGAR